MGNRFIKAFAKVAVFFFIALLGIPLSHAQTNKNQGNGDKEFVQKAYRNGLEAVDMAEIAITRTKNPDVKDFANKVVQDRSASNKQLMELAAKEGVSLPRDIGKENLQQNEKLATMSDHDFDRAYIGQAMKDQQSIVSDYSKEANEGTNPQIKNFASSRMPDLENHLSLAASIDRKIGGKKA